MEIKRRDFMKLVMATVVSTVTPRIIAKQIKPLRNLEAIYHIMAIEYDERIYDDDSYEGSQQLRLMDKKEAEEFAQRIHHNMSRLIVEFDSSYRLFVGDIITIDNPKKQMDYRIIKISQLWTS